VRVLITGGGGFLGRYIVNMLLDLGYEVNILGRSPQPDLEKRGARFFQGDIANKAIVLEASKGTEAIFHVAAKAGIWGSWKDYYEVNVVGTKNVIEACKANQVSYLVYTSTPSVVFNRQAFRGDDESLPYGQNWLCHYAHTKAIAEKMVLDSNDQAGLKTIALRPHLIWGVGDNHLVPRILSQARRGKLRIIGMGDNKVDITHVSNAAHAHFLALNALIDNQVSGKAYFISQGEPVNLWDWVNTLLERFDIPRLHKKISFDAAFFIGALLEGVHKIVPALGEPRMTRFIATELSKDHYFDISAAKYDLGYQPIVSTEAGLDELVKNLKI